MMEAVVTVDGPLVEVWQLLHSDQLNAKRRSTRSSDTDWGTESGYQSSEAKLASSSGDSLTPLPSERSSGMH